jgi:nitrite reductase (NADH) large subunit
MPTVPLLVVGNGMAGQRLLGELAARGAARGAIAVGADPHPAYNRILLAKVVAGETTSDAICLAGRDWYAQHGIELVTGDPIADIDRDAKIATTQNGRKIAYEKLVLATGSQPIRLKLPGVALAGVVAFRDRSDADFLASAPPETKAVVIGGGLLGLEAAAGLAARGLQVSLVHLMPDLMERQLDEAAAALLANAVAARGIALHLAALTQAILGEGGRVRAVRLADGTEIQADLVVMAVGVAPDAELARKAGLACARGIVVDDRLATSDPAIAALGECIEHRGQIFGLVGPIWDQARVLADRLCGGSSLYEGSCAATSLKVSGVDLFSAGAVRVTEDAEALVFADPAARTYRKLAIRDGRLVGAVLYGDAADGPWFADLIAAGTPVDAWRDTLIFGRDYVDTRRAAE